MLRQKRTVAGSRTAGKTPKRHNTGHGHRKRYCRMLSSQNDCSRERRAVAFADLQRRVPAQAGEPGAGGGIALIILWQGWATPTEVDEPDHH